MATVVLSRTARPTVTATLARPQDLPSPPALPSVLPFPSKKPPHPHPSVTTTSPPPSSPLLASPPAALTAAASAAGLSLTSLVPSRRLLQLTSTSELLRYHRMTTRIPSTLPAALGLFLSSPGIVLGVAATLAVAGLRAFHGDFSTADAAVVLATAAWWLLQEWLLHSQLLHAPVEWWGTRAHDAHHDLPYYHVSIDGPKVVLPTLLLSAALLHLILPDTSLFLTSLGTYYTMGLLYEWTHFLVHTRVPMQSAVARLIRNAHVRHHLRSRDHWFSFMCPPLDQLLGTVPEERRKQRG